MPVNSVFSDRRFRLLWIIFLVSLPVTSFPYLPAALGGTATVRPLSIYPLVLLLGVVLVRHLFRERLPRSYLPLVIFILMALASSALAIIRPVPDFRGVTSADRVIRNLLTLGLGVSFYFVVSLVPRTREDLIFTVRWLLIGFGVALVWSSVQSLYVLNLKSNPAFWNPIFERLNDLHHLVSTRNLQKRRVTGLAYEPSWYAEQLSILVLPWLLTSAIRRKTFFRRRFKQLMVEDVLLVWTIGILVLTFSRTGLVILFLLLGLTILLGTQRKVSGKYPALNILSAGNFWQRAGLFAAVAVVLGAVIFSASANNRYFSRLWSYWSDDNAAGDYWTYIAFGQRFIYWEAAVSMFESEPVFGIGLGNFALYLDEHLPEVKLYRYPEILELIVPEKGANELVTPKNLFIRVLAETGVFGLAFFGVFLLQLLAEALGLWWNRKGDETAILAGRAGVLGLLAAVLVAFSTDSFAMPNLWVMAGLITAAARISPQQEADIPEA